MLTRVAEGLHVVAAPQRFLFLELGTRMTVIELEGGGVALHSPVPFDARLADEVARLGEVRCVIAPNVFHHLHVGPWLAASPGAVLCAPDGLRKKRPDLRIDHALHGDGAVPELLRGTLQGLHINGCDLDETVFVHPRSRTVVSADLAENFTTSPHLPTKLYLKVAGLENHIGWSRLLRMVYRDRKAAKASVEQLLGHDFDRIVVAHGSVIERGGKDAVRQTFRFLGL